MPARLVALIVVFSALCAACGKDATTTAASGTSDTSTRELFQGTLSSLDSRFYSFNLTSPSPVQITLVSLITGAPAPTVSVPMRLGVGVPNGADCEVIEAVITAPGLTSQLSIALGKGTYCAKLSDVGNLRTPAAFTVRIVHQ